MKRKFLFLLPLFMFALSSSAQYSSAIGLRFGYPTSLSYKTFISDNNAVELMAGFRSYSGYSWFNVGGLYEIHKNLNIDNLRWYYGGGASAYFWSFDNGFLNNDASNVSFGLSGVLGLDYKLEDIPLNLSIDWVPTFFIGGYGSGFEGSYGGLSARYVLGNK